MHPAFVFAAPPALSDDYIAEHTKIAGKSGHLYILPDLAIMHPLPAQTTTLWDELKAENFFKEFAGDANIGKTRWVIVSFLGLRLQRSVLTYLRDVLQCDIFAVGHMSSPILGPADQEQMTAIFRRDRNRQFDLFSRQRCRRENDQDGQGMGCPLHNV